MDTSALHVPNPVCYLSPVLQRTEVVAGLNRQSCEDPESMALSEGGSRVGFAVTGPELGGPATRGPVHAPDTSPSYPANGLSPAAGMSTRPAVLLHWCPVDSVVSGGGPIPSDAASQCCVSQRLWTGGQGHSAAYKSQVTWVQTDDQMPDVCVHACVCVVCV